MPPELQPFLSLGDEVAAARSAGRPLVALESTIVCHGMRHPRNVQTALRMQEIIRDHGATPAMIAVIDGKPTAGLSDAQIEHLGEAGEKIAKASRRDLPVLAATQESGATTVAATMVIAAMADIAVFATGGIGGVHRDADTTMDISADLQELAHTNVAVVCAGVKSVLDIAKTLEYLETQGVPVLGFETDTLPAFYTVSSGLAVDRRMDRTADIARTMRAKWDMGLDGGLLVGVPIPAAAALEPEHIDNIIDEALQAMRKDGVTGKATTPYLLQRIAEQTQGESLDANIALALNNARVAAGIAVHYQKLSTS